jgi:hypothetical protein
MNARDQKFECLKLASVGGASSSNAVARAAAYFEFIDPENVSASVDALRLATRNGAADIPCEDIISAAVAYRDFLKVDDEVKVDWIKQSVSFYGNGSLRTVVFNDDQFGKALLDGKTRGLTRQESVIEAARSKAEQLLTQKLQS